MLEQLSRDSAPESIFTALERDGAAIVEGFLDDARVERLRDDFGPHLEAVDWCNTDGGLTDSFFGLRTKRLHGLLAKAPSFAELVTDPLLLDLGAHFLKPRCRDFRVSTGELMALGRGQEDQLLHRDADSWSFFPQPRPEILVSATVALTDFSLDNGATVVVPGSHLWEVGREPEPDEKARAVMPRGSALLYSGNVLHGGGANRTDEIRIGCYVGYLLSWLRPIEDHLVTNGVDALRAALPRARRLFGFNESGFEAIA